MTTPLTVKNAQGRLATWDADTLGALIVDATGAAAASSDLIYVSEVVADEIDGEEYARATFTAAFDTETGVLGIDPEDAPEADTTGTTPAGVWFYDPTGANDAARELIAFLPVAAGPGFAGWEINAPNGIAKVRPEPAPSVTSIGDLTPDEEGNISPEELNAILDVAASQPAVDETTIDYNESGELTVIGGGGGGLSAGIT